MVFNATFNNILAISWQSIYWWWNRSTQRKPASQWKTLSHNVVSSTLCLRGDSNSQH